MIKIGNGIPNFFIANNLLEHSRLLKTFQGQGTLPLDPAWCASASPARFMPFPN